MVNIPGYKVGKDNLHSRYLINDLYNQILPNMNYIK
nr:MAG TPA: hypothetical protein [Caudoviricetes sp.]